MAQDRAKPLPISPEPADLPEAVRHALRAWGKGEMTPGQQMLVLGWIVGPLCQCETIDPPDMPDTIAGFTRGQRRVGMVLARYTGIRFRLPNEEKVQ